MINGVMVTEEEYKKAQENYSDDSPIPLGHELILSESVIEGAFSEITNWKECYKKIVYSSKGLESWYRFSLYDVTGDDIPELFISYGLYRLNPCCVYSFQNGLMPIGYIGTYGSIAYSPSKDLFYNYEFWQGHKYFIYYTLDEDNNFQCEVSLHNNEKAAQSEGKTKYEINNKEVTYDEYKKVLDQYSKIDDYIYLGLDYDLNIDQKIILLE